MTDGKLYRGLKAFTLTRSNEGLFLQGGFGTLWPSITLRAACKSRRNSLPTKEDEDTARNHLLAGKCTCGIYTRTNSSIKDYGNIYASVIAWGAIVEGEDGFRAEYVKIDKLWLNLQCAKCRKERSKTKNEAYRNFYAGEKSHIYQGSACIDHVKDFVLDNVDRRTALYSYRVEEMGDQLKKRYDVEMAIGDPWKT